MTFMILQQHKDNQLERCVYQGFGSLPFHLKALISVLTVRSLFYTCTGGIVDYSTHIPVLAVRILHLYLYWRYCWLLYTHSCHGCQDSIPIPVLEVLLYALHKFLSWLTRSYTYTCTGGIVDCSTHIPVLAVRICSFCINTAYWCWTWNKKVHFIIILYINYLLKKRLLFQLKLVVNQSLIESLMCKL